MSALSIKRVSFFSAIFGLLLLGVSQPALAVNRTSSTPAPVKLCQYDCVEQTNIWTGSYSGGTQVGQACQCLVYRTRPVHPQTAGDPGAFTCTGNGDCPDHCAATCGSQGGTCFGATSITQPNCVNQSPPPGCSLMMSGSDAISGDLNGSAPECVTVSTPAASSGSGSNRGSSSALINPLGRGTTLFTIASRVIRAVVGIVGSIALLMFIYGGLRWMTAGGSEEGVKTARSILTNSVIGLLLIFFSYTIIAIFLSAFNLPPDTGANTTAPTGGASTAAPTPAPTAPTTPTP